MATNNALNNQSTQAFSLPGNPAFQASVTATSAGVTGDGTIYDVAAWTEDYDVGGGFNATTGVFTAPVTGKYVFTANIIVGSLTNAATQGYAYFTGGGGGTVSMANWATSRNLGTNQYNMTGSVIVDLAVNDTFKISIQESGTGAKTVTVVGGAGNSTFSGQMIS